AGHTGAIFLPAAPACEQQWIESPLWNGTLPRIPVERLRRKIKWRWILPRAGGIVAAERAFNQHQIAESSFCDQFFRLGANYLTHTLRADLHDPSSFFGRTGHFNAFSSGVRHGLFAIDIFARAHGIDDDLLVPMVWDRCYEAVDIFVRQEFLIAPSCW